MGADSGGRAAAEEHKGGGQWGRGPGLDWSALEGCPGEEAEVQIRRISGDWTEGPWSVLELRLDCVTVVAREGLLHWCWAAGRGFSVIVGFVEQGWIPASEPSEVWGPEVSPSEPGAGSHWPVGSHTASQRSPNEVGLADPLSSTHTQGLPTHSDLLFLLAHSAGMTRPKWTCITPPRTNGIRSRQ